MATAKENKTDFRRVAVWAITPNGAGLAEKITDRLPADAVFLSDGSGSGSRHTHGRADKKNIVRFRSLAAKLPGQFHRFRAHVFIFAAGIAVRLIAPLLRSKTSDPAVVVVDEKGIHAISLVSGHLGGGNELTRQLAAAIHAIPVITTATDINHLPSIDLIAADNDLVIENPGAIKHVNMKVLKGVPVAVYDPEQRVMAALPDELFHGTPSEEGADLACTWRTVKVSRETLVLRPRVLAMGVGCNRGTPVADILSLVDKIFSERGISPLSVAGIGTTSVKADEQGILLLGERLELPIRFYNKDQLNSVESIETPSKMVEKHLGVKSVCEASAILSAENGELVVPKQKTKDVTLAIARQK